MTTTYAPELVEVADGPEAMFELLEARGLGDGLPVVPPTPARVEAMLEYADGDPDEVLFTLQPRSGVLTRRVAAINAVLAGCPPVTFPVVLTALRALAEPEVNLRGVNATTHLVAPLILVHGEVVPSRILRRRRLFRPRQPGERDRRPGGAADRCCTSPAPSPASVTRPPTASRRSTPSARRRTSRSHRGGVYARSRGVDAPSAVTVHCGEGPHNVHDAEAAGDPALILDKIASAMTSLGHEQRADQPGRVLHHPGPEHAASMAQRALSRKDVSSYLFDRARMPASRLPPPLRGAGLDAVDEDRSRRPSAADDRRAGQHQGRGRRRSGQAFARDPVVGDDPQRHACRLKVA